MKKKASLSLSINAIVVLVLAITMLGLGLAFTKGMFGKLSSKLSVPEPDYPATKDDPIVLSTDKLDIEKSKEFIFSVSVYNDEFSGAVTGSLECPDQSGAGAMGKNSAPPVVSAPQEIPPADKKTFKFIVPASLLKITSTRVCSLEFWDASEHKITKQIVVAIK